MQFYKQALICDGSHSGRSMTASNKSSKILGHRGARGECLENSHTGFKHAQNLISKGLAGIEFDVQLTADKQLIVFHDDVINRIYNQQGRVDQLTTEFFACHQPLLSEFNQLIVSFEKNTQQVILLKKMIPLLLGYQHIELEIKTHQRTDYHALIASLADSFAEIMPDLSSQSNKNQIKSDCVNLNLPITLTSFDKQLLLLLQQHKQLSQLPRGLLIEEQITDQEIVHTAQRLQCSQVGVCSTIISKNLVDLCHLYDLKITAWTVNQPLEAKKFITWGVDWIITDYPNLFLELFTNKI